MRPISSILAFSAVAAALGVTACASTDYSYSQLYGTRWYRAPIDTYPVTILRVDGKDTLPRARPVPVEPGMRRITVQGPPGGTGGIGIEREISLEITPCTRYYLVAVKANALASDFTVRVDYQEPVGGCSPPRTS